ncbi:MAG: LacI family DNA-binding transcriptional regulator [Rhodobacterales bacterium]|nr:LacI family DNA-binding transcriptional regulator [Rhodobacterales bacterium]
MSQKTGRVTLKNVAQAAGVSEMTVSRVLRQSGTVSERTRAHVRQIVESMGYVQNHMAGSLATSRSNQVAVIIPSLINNVFTEVVAGIADALERAGYNAIIGVSDYNLDREEALIASMMSWRPAGMILSNIAHTARATNILRNAAIPLVEMMNLTRTPIDTCVGVDQAAAGRALAGHLIARGYRRFGYVGWHDLDFSAAARLSGMQQVITAGGGQIVLLSAFDSPPDIAAGKSGLRRLLQQQPTVEAVIFSNDTAATGGYLHCVEAGIDVPGDLALAGFSGLQMGQTLPRKLTTVMTQRYDIGRISARCILNRLAGQSPDRVVDMKFALIEGETS